MKLIAVLPYILIAAGLLSTLALFTTLKREILRYANRDKRRLENMMERLIEAERVPEPAALAEPGIALVPAPMHGGLNLSKRVHAMRMLRRGEDVAHIAAALGVPRREVELMIRVQSIGKARAANANSD
jgi:hypothetical protein